MQILKQKKKTQQKTNKEQLKLIDFFFVYADLAFKEICSWLCDSLIWLEQLSQGICLISCLVYKESNNFIWGGARGVVVIVIGNGHGDTSMNVIFLKIHQII